MSRVCTSLECDGDPSQREREKGREIKQDWRIAAGVRREQLEHQGSHPLTSPDVWIYESDVGDWRRERVWLLGFRGTKGETEKERSGM